MIDYTICDNKVTFYVNSKIYDKTCVMKTAYVFIDRCYVYIDIKENMFEIVLTNKKGKTYDLNEILGEFNNELLNQQLRKKISEDTKEIRQLVLARALYSSYVDIDDNLKSRENTDPVELMDNSNQTNNILEYDFYEIAKDWFDGR